MNLRWKDINMERRTANIETNPSFKSKPGRRRAIPLDNTAFYLLQSRFGKATPENIFTLNGKTSLR